MRDNLQSKIYNLKWYKASPRVRGRPARRGLDAGKLPRAREKGERMPGSAGVPPVLPITVDDAALPEAISGVVLPVSVQAPPEGSSLGAG